MLQFAAAAGSNHRKNVFVPLTVGGGIRTVDDFRDLLRAGADKISVNSAAVRLIASVSSKSNPCLQPSVSIDVSNISPGAQTC